VSLARLWAFLAIGLPVLGALLANLQTVDLAYHLRAGGMILDTKAIPTVDTYTFTAAGQPWQDQQWGAQVILGGVYRLAGWTGLVLLRAALVGVLFGIVFDLCRRGHTTRTAALLTLAAFGLGAVTLALRPQLFAMVLFAATLWLVLRRREHPRAIWLAVPIAALWANLHGSFFLGPAVLGLACLDEIVERRAFREARQLLVVAVVAAAATLANPLGIGVWQYVAGISSNAVITSRITEWQPTLTAFPENVAFLASCLFIAIVLAFRYRRDRRVPASALVWLLPFAALGLWTVRGLAWWPIVAAVTVARLTAAPDGLAPRERRDTATMRRLNTVVAGVLVFAAAGLLPVWRPQEPGLDAPLGVVGTAPPGVTLELRKLATADDRLFAPQPWGSWFEFALPQTAVFIDSRIELFPVSVWDDYDTIVDGGEGSQQILDGHGVTIVVAAEKGDRAPLAGRLSADPSWRQVYADDDGLIFVRADRGSGSLPSGVARR
jgi:hypothetical protein